MDGCLAPVKGKMRRLAVSSSPKDAQEKGELSGVT